DDWEGVEKFGKAKKEWLESILELPNGIPSHDTFWRVFGLLDGEVFAECFSKWMSAVCQVTNGEVVAIDGKQLRRSHDKTVGKGAIYMVSAWASLNKVVLGQWKVDEKSNEITAIPELLRLLEIKGHRDHRCYGCSD
ncbi:ISAs1 family transposase, partial [Chloroflexi bacterium TSY]|nr:ISAs1 family transposase [Chloroflexi bacterium TSY]